MKMNCYFLSSNFYVPLKMWSRRMGRYFSYLIILQIQRLESVLQTKLPDNPPPPEVGWDPLFPQVRPLPLPHIVTLGEGHKAPFVFRTLHITLLWKEFVI